MQNETYNPEQAAAAVGNVSASTIRNWCKVYAPLLSNGANPSPGTERRLTNADIAMLQQVKLLRDNRVDAATIIATLQQAATIPEQTSITIDVTPESPQSAQATPNGDSLLPVVLSTIEARQKATDAQIEATGKRIDNLQQTIATLEQRRGERVNSLIVGIVIGAGITLVVVALVVALWR